MQVVTVSSLSNNRLRNQEGKFTLSRCPQSSLEEYVAQFKSRSDVVHLKQFVIPISEAS